VLLMGGDQVYPLASGDGYENRMKGPYRAALPEPPADGRTHAVRAAGQPRLVRRPDRLPAPVRPPQGRAHRRVAHAAAPVLFRGQAARDWWLFAIDEQFGAYIDDPQLLYFEKAAREVGPRTGSS
jgi:hypothetical protein